MSTDNARDALTARMLEAVKNTRESADSAAASAQQAQNKVAEIDHASYLVTLPASAAAALDAYNAAENAMVVKKTKRGQKTLDLKAYLDRIAYTVEGDTLHFTAVLPCGSGEALNLNPALLTDFLREQGAAPVWQCRVVRTHLYNKAGKDFE